MAIKSVQTYEAERAQIVHDMDWYRNVGNNIHLFKSLKKELAVLDKANDSKVCVKPKVEKVVKTAVKKGKDFYKALTVKELKLIAKELGIKRTYLMNEDKIIKEILKKQK